MNIEAVIFDMDGVIFDSEKVVYNLWVEYGAKVGLKDVGDVIYKCIGINKTATKKIFAEAYGEDFSYDEHRKHISAGYHELCDGGKLPKKPGIEEILISLRDKNIKTAVASSTATDLVNRQLKDAGLYDYFVTTIGGDMVSRSKPDPDIFLKAAEELKVSPSACIVIEDSHNGIKAAHNANMNAIMVPDLLPPNEEMEAKSLRICKDLFEASSFIDSLMGS